MNSRVDGAEMSTDVTLRCVLGHYLIPLVVNVQVIFVFDVF